VACFYTDALRERLEVDVTFQNSGGIRSTLNKGEITIREIYEIDPFNNGTIIYSMTVAEIKDFIRGSNSKHFYSGITIDNENGALQILDENGNPLSDNQILSVGINDYIPTVDDIYFPSEGEIQGFSTAEALIHYLKNINSTVSYQDCTRYF